MVLYAAGTGCTPCGSDVCLDYYPELKDTGFVMSPETIADEQLFCPAGTCTYVLPATFPLTPAQISALTAYLNLGNGLIVVGNADSWPGTLDSLPVNKLIEPFGLRVARTTGVETGGGANANIAMVGVNGTVTLGSSIGGLTNLVDVEPPFTPVNTEQGTLLATSDVTGELVCVVVCCCVLLFVVSCCVLFVVVCCARGLGTLLEGASPANRGSPA